LKPGDVIGVKEKSAANGAVTSRFRGKDPKINWLEWNEKEMKGTYILTLSVKAFLKILKSNLL
jgi:small subunit ribosomal protein S4